MTKRPSIPRRLTGTHPRNAAGRFISQRAARGQITRLRAAQTRYDEQRARVHGQQARERTEARQSPQKKAARTRDAKRFEREVERQSPKPSQKEAPTLDDFLNNVDYGDPHDFEDYDVEVQPDTGKKGKK